MLMLLVTPGRRRIDYIQLFYPTIYIHIPRLEWIKLMPRKQVSAPAEDLSGVISSLPLWPQ